MNEEQNIKLLPKGWKWVKLGEIGKIISGGTPSTSVQEYWNGKVNWISPADLTGYKKKTIINGTKSISEVGLKNSSARLMPKGSVLFSSRAPIGYVVIAGSELSTNQGFKSIIPNENVDSDYVYYFLKGAKQKAEKVASGTTFKEISLGKFSELEFPLPPKPTQQATVAKIEELFSELDKGIENLRTAQQQLKTYRQSVLKWAFEVNGQSVKVKLVEICDFITKGTTPSKEKLFTEKGEIPFLKVYNLTFDGTLNFLKDPTFVAKDTHKYFLKRSNVYPGDVLMNIVGPPLGKVSIVPQTNPEWNINQAIARFRCKPLLFNKYLLYFLLSENTIRAYSKKAKATAGQFNLTLEICRDIEITLPSFSEQQSIVQEIESRLSVADKMEESIIQSLQQAEALRQSILKKAFEGILI